jgi:transcription antitermination factor NusG
MPLNKNLPKHNLQISEQFNLICKTFMREILSKLEKKWYLVYTNPRAEKKVAAAYDKMGLEYFLPLQRTIKQWSDRKKWVEEPLFKSYIFINIELEKSYYEALSVLGASKLINYNGRPAVVDTREINLVKRLLGHLGEIAVTGTNFGSLDHQEGEEVEIIAGPLMGCEGKFMNKRGNQQVVIELKSMQQVVCVSLPLDYIRIKKNKTSKIA